jgi:hypothetical protein
LSSDSADSFDFGQNWTTTSEERADPIFENHQADATDHAENGFAAASAWTSHEGGQETDITHWAHSFVHDSDLLMA